MHSAFVSLPTSFRGTQLEAGQSARNVCRGGTRSNTSGKGNTRTQITSTRVRRTKAMENAEQTVAEGPCCRLVDVEMLRNCLKSAKTKQAEHREKETMIANLLKQARQALGHSQFGRAERIFLRALAVDPFYWRTYLLYALQAQKRDPVLARELFYQGVLVQPENAKLYQAWGLFESKYGRLNGARSLIKKSVALEPKHAPVLKWKVLFP